MSSPFGDDSFNIEQELRKLLPEADPLQDTPFFPHLAEDLSDARDAASFDAAYSAAAATLPRDLKRELPSGFDRRILMRLCSNPRLLEDWARQHYSFVVLSTLDIGATLRFLFWNRYLWPFELALYTWLGLCFGAPLVNSIFRIDVTVPTILLGQLLGVVYIVAAMIYLTIFFLAAIISSLSAKLPTIVAILDARDDRQRAGRIARRAERNAQRQPAPVNRS
jgi:hypothetical protein